MTIKTTATGDGVEDTFQIGFPYLAETDLRVFVNGTLKVRGTDYSVVQTEQSRQEGGAKNSIKFGSGDIPSNGQSVKIVRNTTWAVNSNETQKMGHDDALRALYKQQEMKGKDFSAIPFHFDETDLLAGTAISIEAPCDGTVDSLRTLVSKAVTTGGAITVEIDGAAVTGLSITVANSAIVGTTQEDTPTTPGSAATQFRAGSLITITPAAAFATAGEVQGILFCTPADL